MKEIPPLRDYQMVDLTFYYTQPRVGNFADPGTGKTPPTCVYTYGRCVQDGCRAVWVQPKSLIKKNWEEVLRFTPFTSNEVGMMLDMPKAKRQAMLANPPKVLLMTADALRAHWQELPPDVQLLVGDEWHLLFKGHDSARTQALDRFMRRCKHLVAMTGTMVHGRLDSAYPFIRLVDPRYYPSHEAFLNHHAVRDEFDGKIVGWRNHAKLARIFGRHAIRRTMRDIHGPQEIVEQVERVEMSQRQRWAYEDLEERGVLELERVFVGGLDEGPTLAILRAIMEHPEKIRVWDRDLSTGKRVLRGHEDLMKGELAGKDARLLVHVEDHVRAGTPFVYFGARQLQLERVAALLPKHGVRGVGLIHGGVPGPKRVAIDEAFRAGELQAIVASAQTAGIGFNWQHWGPRRVEVDHVIFGSLDYMDTSVDQGKRRFIRGERQTPLRVTFLEYDRSVDQRIRARMRQKSEDAHRVDPTREVLSFAADS